MSNVEILGRSNRKTMKTLQTEWNKRIDELSDKSKKANKKSEPLVDLIYERDGIEDC